MRDVQSLFILALPRSLTTLVYRASARALGLHQPGWTCDGEIMNFQHFAGSGHVDGDKRFTSETCDAETFARLQAYLRDCVHPRNYAYKDVVHPFVTASILNDLGTTVLNIRRPLTDIAMAMKARDWSYPSAAAQSFASENDGDLALVEGLVRAANALSAYARDSSACSIIDCSDLTADEGFLSNALARLYPDERIGPIAYIDGAFRRHSDSLMLRRKDTEYQDLRDKVDRVLDRLEIALPEAWHPPREAKAPHRSAQKAIHDKAGKPKLLVVGDAVAPTGFSRVTHAILSRLNGDFDIHQIGINYSGDPHDLPWAIYPAGVNGDPHGVNRIAELVQKIQPDVVFMVNDLWIIGDYLDALAKTPTRARTLAYVPIDAAPVPQAMAERIARLDRLIVYTDFAAEVIRRATLDLEEKPQIDLPPIDIIPHGVDTDIFHPLFPISEGRRGGRRAVKIALLPDDRAFQESFIILNANRNQPRKRIDATIEGFARFAADKPENVKLYLHMGNLDQGWNVQELAKRHGILRRLIMSHADEGPPNLTVAQLNQMYNACDVGLNTAEGEGWGLPAFEHAATGAAQVLPAHPNLASLWNDSAELIEVHHLVTNPGTMSDAQLVSPVAVAAALERLYADPDLLHQKSMAAYRTATDPRLSWDGITTRFRNILLDLCH